MDKLPWIQANSTYTPHLEMSCNLGVPGSNPGGGFRINLEDFMLKKIAVMFCVLFVGSTAVLFSSGKKEENLLDNQRSVSVVIRHCTSWAYKTTAARLAEEIKKELDLHVDMKPGEFHSFDVLVDDKLIFSKFEEGRFPEPEEIIETIRSYLENQ